MWSKINKDPDKFLIPGDKPLSQVSVNDKTVVGGDETYVKCE